MQGQTIEAKIVVDAKQATAEIAKFESQAKQAEKSLMDVGRAMPQLEKSTQSAGSKMLILGQAVDDAQYGLRGVVNNMPQVAQAFGGGAGLAGAVGIAAVAVSLLYDKYQQYNAIQKEVTENMHLWRAALDETTKLMREGTVKQTSDMVQLLKDAQTEIRNFGKTASEVRMMDARESLAASERTLSILEKNLPGFEERAAQARRSAGAALAIEGEPALESMRVAKEEAMAIIGIYENATKRRQEISGEIAKQKQALSDLEAATKKLNELEKTKPKKAAARKEEKPEFLFDTDVIIGNMELAEERLRKFGADSAVSIAKSTDQMLTDIATRGADLRLAVAEQEAQSISATMIGAMGGLDQMTVGAVSTVASGISQVAEDMITGQEHIAERFAALVMQQAGQSLVSSGTKLAGEAVVSALTPGGQALAVTQAGAAAGLIATGIGLGGVAAGIEHMAAGGKIGKPIEKSGERDRGVAPRSSRDRGGGPLVINVSYGVGGPLPEDTAREIAKVQRQGARRGGA